MVKLKFAYTDLSDHQFMTSASLADIYKLQIWEAQMAEQLGFDQAMCTAPSVFMSSVAQATSSIRLSVHIYLMPFHNPLRLAQDVAMLDQLSEGRVEFGAGSGVLKHEFTRWDLPFDERREMSEEALEIVKLAWTQESFTYDGKYWKFEEALPWPMPYQKPHPPIWLACASPNSFERAARDNLNVAMALDPPDLTAEKLSTWRSLWKEAGHEGPMPHSSHLRTVYVAETDKKAREEVDSYIRVTNFLTQSPRVERTKIGMDRGSGTPGATTGDHTPERLEAYRRMGSGVDFWIESGRALVGNPDTVARGIEEQQRLIGFDHLACTFRPGNIPTPLVEKSMKLFGREIIPAFS